MKQANIKRGEVCVKNKSRMYKYASNTAVVCTHHSEPQRPAGGGVRADFLGGGAGRREGQQHLPATLSNLAERSWLAL